MNEYIVYEARRYHVKAETPQEALEAARSFPHQTMHTEVEIVRASVFIEDH